MTNPKLFPKKLTSGEFDVTQTTIGDLEITFNPDDNRFYVEKAGAVQATFNRFSNAVYYCRTKQIK
jgi:hypothetical protein